MRTEGYSCDNLGRRPLQYKSSVFRSATERQRSFRFAHIFVSHNLLTLSALMMASRLVFGKEHSYGQPGADPIFDMKSREEHPVEEIDEPGDDGKGGTQVDRKDMYRLNKVQELQRNFRFFSMFGYSLIIGNGWVIALIAAVITLSNGGTAGGIWMYLVIIIGLFFSTLSMAEMASMAPTVCDLSEESWHSKV